ncbi:nucleoid occlusion protein [Salisediminibacterium halotolerans]|uniref:Chromosome partitioning protein, ParB family n=1 Tax=Salisediminibacterium halotolerans TaxID=517425 RepID=A0A1H9WIC1_9BACI|nr:MULTISPECIES: nucleoid occlusion protein [Salisediminibacterium]RLJ69726.1 Effector of nucleoid occlusion Noc [Actinophytocola xinjiangensis]RPE89784.1 Effector of nucleoid occlusion Noc [Salisediminibacterium halotolerans]TWG32620.1 Effector of nucleoid occlusion Noc [Salisediminibacterium halotolerans]SES33676.1 chromosome partitioning protein, ParB family [Salisediminibacterium haloalkalitolerans]GEL07568.1 nucleoid occlusion protein [Salisediminibacterium halotolerans]
MKQSFSKLFGLHEKDGELEEEMDVSRQEVQQLPLEEIVPNPFQPRTVFDEEKIEELAETLRTHGMIQPIVVREREGKYEIIAGERRYRAVQMLQWETVPSVVKEFDDAKTASIALIENLQREELTSIEEAKAYRKLLDIHGLTQESLAQRIGKSQSAVANKMRLLQLIPSVQNALLERRITERHARSMLGLKDPELQEKLLNKILQDELNVQQTEETIKKWTADKPEKKQKPVRKAVSKDTRLAVNTIRESVDMVAKTGMDIDTEEEDYDDYYQVTIRIPKSK